MKRWTENWQLPSREQIIVSITAVVLAFLMGRAIALLSFGVRELAIVVLVIIGAFLILVPTARVIRFGFVLWILTFSFGWRTLYLTPNFNIHPIEVLAYVLTGLCCLQVAVRRSSLNFRMPIPMVLFLGFCTLGVITAAFAGTPLDIVLEESKNFLVLVPAYYLVQWLIRDRSDWERVAWLAIVVATYISLLGLMDYFLPGLSRSIANSPNINPMRVAIQDSGSEFTRVGFVFYGSFAAGFVIFTFFGFSLHQFLRPGKASAAHMAISLLSIGLQLAGMYLSGYRGLWYSLVAFVIAYALVRRRAAVLAGLGVLLIPFMATEFFSRFVSLFDATQADSSQFKRIARAQGALDLIRGSPWFGVGWGGSGYVHSDLLQIGANLGVPALAVFVVWWCSRIYSTWRLTARTDWIGDYAAALLATLVGLSVTLAGEGLIVFVQLIAPVWFVCAMTYKLSEFAQKEDIKVHGESFSTHE